MFSVLRKLQQTKATINMLQGGQGSLQFSIQIGNVIHMVQALE